MTVNAWLLLAAFLLMQASPWASALSSERAAGAVTETLCAPSCCCGDRTAELSACECAEVPDSDSEPSPAVPAPPSPGRELAASPVWIEVRTSGLPSRKPRDGGAGRRLHLDDRMGVVATVPRTVRFCAFLI